MVYLLALTLPRGVNGTVIQGQKCNFSFLATVAIVSFISNPNIVTMKKDSMVRDFDGHVTCEYYINLEPAVVMEISEQNMMDVHRGQLSSFSSVHIN